ncbi:MAG: glycosyltransferase family 2 protein [Arcticibacter sp.]
MDKPRIGVLMPVYNVAPYIKESIQSILDQSFSDFELLIIDDCSTDETFNIIQSFQDTRIKLIRNDVNKGLVYGLNLGLQLLQNDYIARMDGDDLCLPSRFEYQVRFMDENPDVVLCGSQAYWEEIGQDGVIGKSHKWDYPTSDEAIRVSLLWSASFVHPSVIMRGDVIRRNHMTYDDSYTIACEDWHMWIRLSRLGKIANLNERLLRYRIRKGSLHRSDPSLAMKLNHQVRKFYLKGLGLEESVVQTILNTQDVKAKHFDDLILAYKTLLHNAESKLDANCLRIQIGNRLIETIKNNKLSLFFLVQVFIVGFRPDLTYLKKAIRYSINK